MLFEALLNIISVSTARTLADAARTLGRDVTEEDVEMVTWVMMGRQGRKVDAVTYSRAILTAHQVGLEMARFQENYDVILSPTLGKPPAPLGVLSLSPASIQDFTAVEEVFQPTRARWRRTVISGPRRFRALG